jgi:hypothetical protein
MSGTLNLVWRSPGPVASAFMAADSFVEVLNGPVGSGKTITAMMKAVRRAQQQRPSTRDTVRGPGGGQVPVRKFKLCVVRDTYRQLWRSTMQSWFTRFPRTVGTFIGAEGAPATHQIDFALPDTSIVQFHVDFVALGDQAVEDVLRGYEPTAFYLNELDLLAAEVLKYASGRAGRYPPMEEGGPTWRGIIADCNAPVIDSWLYDKVFLATPEERAAAGIALFRQPGGLEAGAENLRNLDGGRAYYERQVALNRDDPGYVKRMVHNLPGFNRNGKPIYGDAYNDLVHTAGGPIPAVPALPLIVGLDAGGSPAAAFAQRMPSGRWHILDELVSDPGTGPTRFGTLLAQRLHEKFPNWSSIRGVVDPSALYGADRTQGDKDWSEIVAAQAGIRIDPAPTNKPTARWEAVRVPLTRLIDGQPGFLLAPACRVLRAGFNAGYRFRAIQGANGRFSEEAEKTRESHVHDALQYAMSAGGEDVEIRIRRGEDRTRTTALPRVSPAWDPYSTAAGG